MPEYEYRPKDALTLLIRKATEFDKELGEAMERAVAEGKDVQESDTSPRRGRKERKFRKATPYSDEEALEAAMSVFRAALVEIPHITNNLLDQFTEAAIYNRPADADFNGDSQGKRPELIMLKGEAKEVLIDMTVETQLEADKRDDVQIARVPEEQLRSLDETFGELRKLTTFNK